MSVQGRATEASQPPSPRPQSPAARTPYQQAERWCDLACTHERNRDSAQARRAYMKAIAADPSHYRAHFLLSHCLDAAGELAAALVHARKALQLNPTPVSQAHCIDLCSRSALARAQALDLQGMIDAGGELLSMGAEEPAQAVFDFVFEAAGADLAVLHAVCRQLAERHRYAALIATSDARAAAGCTFDSEVVRLRVQAYRSLNDIDAARTAYLQLLKIDAEDRDAWDGLFSLTEGEGHTHAIVAEVEQELDAHPDDIGLCRFAARLWFHLRRVEPALPLYRRLYEHGKFRAEAALRLAQIAYLNGEADAAFDYTQEVACPAPQTRDSDSAMQGYDVRNTRSTPLRGLVAANAPLAFHHMTCTGGDAFMEVIRNTGQLRCHSVPTYEKHTVRTYLEPLKGTELAGHFFNGHGMYGCHLVLDRPVSYITILRDPASRFISEFFWERRDDPRLAAGQHALFDDLLRYIDALDQANLQVYELAQFHHERPIETPHLRPELFSTYSIDAALRIAQQRIRDHFCFVAITEKFEESLFLFFDMLGWPRIQMWNRGPHASGRGGNAKKLGVADLPEASRARLERLLEADRALYDQRSAVIDRLFREADFGEVFERYRSDARQR